jgi:hypothetical protein
MSDHNETQETIMANSTDKRHDVIEMHYLVYMPLFNDQPLLSHLCSYLQHGYVFKCSIRYETTLPGIFNVVTVLPLTMADEASTLLFSPESLQKIASDIDIFSVSTLQFSLLLTYNIHTLETIVETPRLSKDLFTRLRNRGEYCELDTSGGSVLYARDWKLHWKVPFSFT